MKSKRLFIAALSVTLIASAFISVPVTAVNTEMDGTNLSQEAYREEGTAETLQEEEAEEIINNPIDVQRQTYQSTKPDIVPESEYQTEINETYGIISPIKLIEKSDLIVYGEITEIADAVSLSENKLIPGKLDITIQVQETYRGESRDKITFRVDGGLVDGNYTDYVSQPNQRVGDKRLFFLTKPDIEKAAEDYYLWTGGPVGVFKELDSQTEAGKAFAAEDGDMLFISVQAYQGAADHIGMLDTESKFYETEDAANAIISMDNFKDIMSVLNEKLPIRSEEVRIEEMKQAFKTNYENGIITKEGYVELLEELEEAIKESKLP